MTAEGQTFWRLQRVFNHILVSDKTNVDALRIIVDRQRELFGYPGELFAGKPRGWHNVPLYRLLIHRNVVLTR